MPEYVPLFKPGNAVTRRASADLVGGQVVAVTGSGTVGPAGAASASWVGVVAHDAKSGTDVVIHSGGVQRPVASGAVTAGDAVTTAASGKVVTAAAPTALTFVGVAQTTAADGAPVEIQFVR